MDAYRQYAESVSPERLNAAIQQQRTGDIAHRMEQGLNRAGMLISNLPTQAEAVPPWDAVKEYVLRQGNAEKNLQARMQMAQMDPSGAIAQAKIAGLRAAGINLPPGTSPLVADAYTAALKAGVEPAKIQADIESARATAGQARATTANIPVENQIKVATLQKDYDLKGQEILAAAKQGDLNRANELVKARMQIEAEMTRLRANISSENVGDADWQIGDQFAQGNKKLPASAQEFLKKSPGARALLDNSARAEELIRKHPNGVVTGDDAANLHRWLSEMTSQLNGIWGMGVLRQNNMPMLEDALADPTHITSILKTKGKGQDFLNQLHQFQTMVKQRMYSEGTATGALTPRPGGYYEGFKSSSGKTAGESDQPPVAGAVKTKSGRWAVPNAKGQLKYVGG